MSEIFLETRSTIISAVLEPLDTFQGSRQLTGMVNIRLVESPQEPTITPEGYYVFLDLPDGDYTLVVTAEGYEYYGATTFNTTTLDPINGALVLDMEPNTNYTFPADATLLRGIVKDQHGVPVVGVDVTVQGRSEFVRTDVMGNFVMFFNDLTAPELLSLDFAKSGYQGETESVTVIPEQTATVQADLVILSDPDTAVLVGTVVNSAGEPVTQALMEVVSYAKSDVSDLAGQGILALVLGSASESVDVRINQDGYSETIVSVTATKGQTTNFNAVMNLSVQPNTATLEVRTHDDTNADLPGALIEVIEKTRAGLTAAADGTVRFYFDNQVTDPEEVTVRLSKAGYVTKTRTPNLRIGQIKVLDVQLNQV